MTFTAVIDMCTSQADEIRVFSSHELRMHDRVALIKSVLKSQWLQTKHYSRLSHRDRLLKFAQSVNLINISPPILGIRYTCRRVNNKV